ncbi:UDP-glucose 4-epimerase GalE [Desulfotalea psychrophila]|uniref:UDP-glucose 4-epimerase n=1 Tax=Desulfotalea psychrophila (strain LSv54 / DSM 12343) TaxID=177439 RepID=Q6API8_DESPS|nr:UDP-glucose 4-epimerase GalE [Desulfotalea psychrophila]CAG35736.1 probable UDP-glucose 4-epimerase [Desulfotalea psychrophila LSv54]
MGASRILLTGGAGYIGSHTCLELLEAGYQVTVVDDLSNSSYEALCRVESLTGKKVTFHQVNVFDEQALDAVFLNAPESFAAVIHFAGLKVIGESVAEPLRYYHNNITGTLVLCGLMAKHGVKNIIFSSSATVYGDPARVPITEDFPLSCANPYGRTKLMVEEILADLHGADHEWNACLLRYFNPVGAHKSGRIGEDPDGIPNNLIPYIAQVAIGRLDCLSVFGNDYPTVDGTGVRDYIHVVDLAKGHVCAVKKVLEGRGVTTYNLGTGLGYSVLEIVDAFSRACGRDIAYKIVARRAGDIAACYADSAKALTELGWSASLGLAEMCEDTWRWQENNPTGYRS